MKRIIESMEEQCRMDLKDEWVRRLQTIPAVGPIAALTLVASVDRVGRFSSSRGIDCTRG